MNNNIKSIINNAIKTAMKDGYNQAVYKDEDGDYAFSRKLKNNFCYKKENVIGNVQVIWKNGILSARYLPV